MPAKKVLPQSPMNTLAGEKFQGIKPKRQPDRIKVVIFDSNSPIKNKDINNVDDIKQSIPSIKLIKLIKAVPSTTIAK